MLFLCVQPKSYLKFVSMYNLKVVYGHNKRLELFIEKRQFFSKQPLTKRHHTVVLDGVNCFSVWFYGNS